MDIFLPHATTSTWAVCALATAGVIVRPFEWPEAVWAVAGAVALVAAGLLSAGDALVGAGRGTDVYLFLTGMMLLSEVAREQGLFEWLAALATRRAKGSPRRLFLLIYLVGAAVTAFLSNDAAAVVLTPAVAAAVRTAKANDPLPYLFICAFIANAASFVLPISNPANLVIYGAHMPALLHWLPRFALPSMLSVAATFAVLRLTQRRALAADRIEADVDVPSLGRTGKLAAAGLGLTAGALLAASAMGTQLGLPTAICGALTAAVIITVGRTSPWNTVKGVSWAVLPLVAGLFVMVEALDGTGLIRMIAEALHRAARASADGTAWGAGALVAALSNAVNNLPAGLVAGGAVEGAHAPNAVTGAILIGVDLGPNLSVTGSLATILWLTALRREGIGVSAWQFLKLGALVMPPALILALAGLILTH